MPCQVATVYRVYTSWSLKGCTFWMAFFGIKIHGKCEEEVWCYKVNWDGTRLDDVKSSSGIIALANKWKFKPKKMSCQ